MKQLRILVPALLLTFTGCESTFESSAEFLVAVDSIVAPDTVAAGDTLTMAFYGVIGNNSCSSFWRIREMDRSPNRLELRVMARYRADGSGCTPGEVRLNGRVHHDPPTRTDPFRIVVVQRLEPYDTLVHHVHVIP